MSTRAEFFQSMYPGLSNGEVIDELIKASIYGFEHGPEVVTISAAEGIHYVPYDAAMQKKLPYYGGNYEACNIPFTDFQIRYQPEQIRIVDGKRILEDGKHFESAAGGAFHPVCHREPRPYFRAGERR